MKTKKVLLIVVFVLALLGLIFVWRPGGRMVKIGKQSANPINSAELTKGANPLSGLSCQNYQRRPFAVVLANDPVARPLAGLSRADLVFEMPVITGSITRLMAVYLCNSPDEIGSMRSARHDFVPLAMGVDAILVHWGGSHFALDKLDAGIMDNIDALRDPYNAFFRKSGIPRPHNGFTSMERLMNSAKKSEYRLENNFEGYPHYVILEGEAKRRPIESQGKFAGFYRSADASLQNDTLKIGYSKPYNVEYQYDLADNSYLRWRAGKKEIDRSNGRQITAKNVVIMRAFSRQIEEPDYNDLDIEGSGECQVYQNGEVVSCVWQKNASDPKSKLYFLDENGDEIPFVPGQTWIEIVEPGQSVLWE